MGLGQYHGDRAFEAFLRGRRVPYVSVNEARRTLVAPDAMGVADLKSFDFVVYTGAAAGANLLVDVKCRRLPRPRLRLVDADGVRRPAKGGRAVRLESWATAEDVRSLRAWQSLFGPGFRAAFMFVYWCDALPDGEGEEMQPPDGLFDEVFLHEGRWYAVRGVLLDDYEPAMQVRSARWETVDLPPARFERLSEGFGRAWLGGKGGGAGVNRPAQAAAGR